MKKLVKVVVVFVGVLFLVSCGKKDMSGTYYFERSISGSPDVRQLELSKASDDGMKYKVLEAIPANPPTSEGEMILKDKSYLDITMSESSNDLYSDGMDGIDISDVKDEKYNFKNNILTIGEVKFYKFDTKEGKKLKEIWDKGPQ